LHKKRILITICNLKQEGELIDKEIKEFREFKEKLTKFLKFPIKKIATPKGGEYGAE